MKPRPEEVPEQLDLPFSFEEFAGRTNLSVQEVAGWLGCTTRHVCNLIHEEQLQALDITATGSRMCAKIPVKAFRDFCLRSLKGPLDTSPLRHLPLQTMLKMYREIGEHLRSKGVAV